MVRKLTKTMIKFPTSIEGWGGSYNGMEYDEEYIKKQFPAPLEASVVSYMNLKFDVLIRDNVSDPSRGLGSFLRRF